MGHVYRGWALASSGDWLDGLAMARHGTAALERAGARIFLSRAYGVVAELSLIAGRHDEGLLVGLKETPELPEIGEAQRLLASIS